MKFILKGSVIVIASHKLLVRVHALLRQTAFCQLALFREFLLSFSLKPQLLFFLLL